MIYRLGRRVNEGSEKNKLKIDREQGVRKGKRPKRTRGFLRAQKKRERLLELIPEDAVVVGMDLSKREHCVWMSSVKKEPLDRVKIGNSPRGMEAVIEQARQVGRDHDLGKIVFSMEPTGHYWMSLANYLNHRKQTYVLVHPLSVARERESTYYRYAKSDYRDAELIANLTADRKITFTQLETDRVWAGLEVATKEYLLTEMLKTAEHLRLEAFIERLYPGYESVFKDVTSATGLSCMLAVEGSTSMSQVEFLAAARAQGHVRLQGRKIDQFYGLVHSQPEDWGAPVYEEGLQVSVRQAGQRYELLEGHHEQAEQQLLQFYEQTGYNVYADTIPHLSRTTHAAALGLIGDPSKYDVSRCVTRFAGIDIRENESGQYHGQTPITHRGNPLLRYVAYLAGFVLKTQDAVFRERYQYLIHRRKRPLKKNQALVALGCKYLRILWVLCTQKVSYDAVRAREGYQRKEGN